MPYISGKHVSDVLLLGLGVSKVLSETHPDLLILFEIEGIHLIFNNN